jgi:AAA domain/DnaB-like helicase N terminal domain
MLKAPAAVIPIVQQSVAPDHFHVSKNRVLFKRLCDFFNDEGVFDLTIFTQQSLDMGHMADMGGPAYITELAVDFTTVPEMVQYYIDIVKDKYAARQIIRVGQEAAAKAQRLQEGETVADLFDELFTGLERAKFGLRTSLRLPELMDASLFMDGNQPAKPPELITQVLHQGSKMIVGGTSKGRKTMALIDLAVSVATGATGWGFSCQKGAVCYINFEIQDAFFWDRARSVCKAKGVKLDKDMLQVWNLRGHGNGIENLTDDLMAVLRHKKFVLIIIDPIYKALGKRDENKAGDVASMLNELERIAVKTGAAVAFGAHYSKGNQAMRESIDRIGGSGVFARDPDSILTMTTHQEPEAFTVEATLRNFAPIEAFVLRFEWPLFSRAEELDPAALKQSRNAGQFKEQYPPELLLDQLSVVHGARPKDVLKTLAELHGISRKTIYRLKDKLEAKGLLVVKDGLWFRGNGKDQK